MDKKDFSKDRLLTLDGAKEKLGCTTYRMRQMLQNGEIPFYKIGAKYYIALSDIRQYQEKLPKEKMISFSDAAEQLKYGKVRLKKMIEKGTIKHYRIGSRYYLEREEVERLCKANEGKKR